VSVLIATVSMVGAAVLGLRQRTARTARPAAMGAAGALAGVVLTVVFDVRHTADLVGGWSPDGTQATELVVHGGVYVLVIGALTGLVGAVLAQRKQKQQRDEIEEEVVVHQLESDDDTPPFGIAIPDQEEAR
jgi:hypothetical protein